MLGEEVFESHGSIQQYINTVPLDIVELQNRVDVRDCIDQFSRNN